MTSPISVLASAIPRLGVSDADAPIGARAWLAALPRRVETTLAGLGPVAIGLVGLATATSPAPDGPALGLVRAGTAGRLSLGAGLARRLVGRALGADAAATLAPRRLGLGERGLVAGFAAAALHALGADLEVSLVAPAELYVGASDELLAIDLDVEAAGARGAARVEVPRAWVVEAASGEGQRERLATLTIEATIARARTRLPVRALAELEAGDAVVFEGEPAADARAAWPARLVVGAYVAEVEARGDGTAVLLGELRQVDAGADRAPAAADATVVLASAPAEGVVEVVAELARLELRGDEVLGLVPGAVVTLGATRPASVVLRAGGEDWASGVLVDVDGALAVHVTKTFRR